MAPTRLSNVIVPELWFPYVIERTAELSAFWTSGIVQTVPELDGFVNAGGNTMQLPFWQDLDGESEVLSGNGVPLNVNPINAEQDAAVVLARGKAWGVNELAAALTGSDPFTAIGDLVAAWWARDMQKTLFSALEGAFASASMAGNVHDISANSGANGVTVEHFFDAQQKLGDAKDRLAAIAMHSMVENVFAKMRLIDYIPISDAEPRVPFLNGKRVIVSDAMPVVGTGTDAVFTSYIFGEGAVGYANGTNSKVTESETDRDSLVGEDILINRRHLVLHPRGIRYSGPALGGGPTNAVLADGANWTRVYENKNIRMVQFKYRLSNVTIP